MTDNPFADLEEHSTSVRKDASNRPAIRSFSVVVAAGLDHGARVEVDEGRPAILVGQGPACDLRLTDPEVSRRHISLDAAGSRVRIRDLGSTNGTFVENIGMIEGFVSPGETVRIGATTLRIEAANPSAGETPNATAGIGRIWGQSPAMRKIFPLVSRIAGSNMPVVIEGETGTGKEVLAEAIHEASDRSRGPFVVFDCTTIPPSLVESELLGHERGAFTGAVAPRRGLFELAHGGTLLIDEIGDLELALQPKLLRAIEKSEIRRIGADRPIKVDVRILAATRRNLDLEVQAGRFRDDLFHRLAVCRVELPPLRDRAGDIALLAERFWVELGGKGSIPARTMKRWTTERWPGNVRELRNAVARQIVFGDLPPHPEQAADQASENLAEPEVTDTIAEILQLELPLPLARLRVVGELERRYVHRVLLQHGGSVSRAAEASGIGRRYFQMVRGRSKK